MCVLVAQLCPTLSDPMDCSPPGSSVHGIFQARILQIGILLCPLPGDLPNPGIEPRSLTSPSLAGRFFPTRCHLGSPKNKVHNPKFSPQDPKNKTAVTREVILPRWGEGGEVSETPILCSLFVSTPHECVHQCDFDHEFCPV